MRLFNSNITKLFAVSSILFSIFSYAEGENENNNQNSNVIDPAASPVVIAPSGSEQNNAVVEKKYSFNDWNVSCYFLNERDGNNQPTGKVLLQHCAAPFNFIAQKDENVKMDMRLVVQHLPVKDGFSPYPQLLIMVPLPIPLQPIQIKVDENKPLQLNYQICTPNGVCEAYAIMDEKTYSTFKGGSKFNVAILGLKEVYQYEVSLSGFTSATTFLKEAISKYRTPITIEDIDKLAAN